MAFNEKELERMLNEISNHPEKVDEILKSFKIFDTMFDENDGIPPRFGNNFRHDGPKWGKITGVDFDSIGRILVCHLCIEHYIDNLIELSTPLKFNWESSRMSFSQKLNLRLLLIEFSYLKYFSLP